MTDTDTKVTDRGRRHGAYVLVVHDPDVDVAVVCDALKTRFIVRVVDTAFAALERLPESGLACVVCVLGGAMRGSDYFDLASRVAPKQASRTVFIAPTRPTAEDKEFLARPEVTWLPQRARARDLLAVVAAMTATKDGVH